MRPLLLLIATLGPAGVEDSSVRVSVAKAPVVDATMTVRSGGGGNGSGTVVRVEAGHYYVLTCAHVTDSGDLHFVGPAGGPFKAGRVVLSDARLDLALIRVEGQPPPGARVATLAAAEAYDAASTFTKVGFPKAGPRVVLSGKPFPYWGLSAEGVLSVVVGAKSIPGDSGGGLFRASDEALVGVVWGGTGEDLWARTVKDIHPFLKRAYAADGNRPRKPANVAK